MLPPWILNVLRQGNVFHLCLNLHHIPITTNSLHSEAEFLDGAIAKFLLEVM